MASPVRVLFVTHVADRTGAPRVLYEIVKHLPSVAPGVAAEILVLKDGVRRGAFEQLAPVTLHMPDLAAFDVLYVNSTGCLPGLQARSIKLPTSTSYVLHVHEVGAGLDGVEPAIAGRLPDRIVACAHAVQADVRARWSAASVVCHEFIDVDSTRRRAALPTGDPSVAAAMATLASARARGAAVVGAVGTRWPYKGPDLFWRVAALLLDRPPRATEILFVWIGGAESDMAPEARCARDLVPARHRLEIDEVANPLPLLAALDALLVAGRDDPFPLACLEAAALGVPAVAFDVGGIQEFLTPSGGKVIPAFDLASVVDAVSAWLKDVDARRDAAARLSAAVQARHDVAQGVRRLADLVESLVHRPADDRSRAV